MAAKNYSAYQQKVIGRYYENIDTIALQKLQELVTELYLAMNTNKEDKLWERVEKAMTQLKVKKEIHEHIMRKRDVKTLALNLEDWLKQSKAK